MRRESIVGPDKKSDQLHHGRAHEVRTSVSDIDLLFHVNSIHMINGRRLSGWRNVSCMHYC